MVPGTPAERGMALWSFAYFFMLLAGCYVLRPLRDQMGTAGGIKALPWMFTATFLTLLMAQLCSACTSRVCKVGARLHWSWPLPSEARPPASRCLAP